MSESEWDPKKNWYMIPVKQLLTWGQFASYQQTVRQLSLLQWNRTALEDWFLRNPIPIFVSHRWDMPEEPIHLPDPTGRQFHILIRFLVEAICLCKGICERYFSYAEPEIVLNPQLRSRIEQHQGNLSRGMDEWQEYQRSQGKSPFGPPMEILLARWLNESFNALTFRTEEIVTISSVLRDMVVWYDYCSMPQKPYTSEMEESYFKWALKHIEHLISTTNVVVIWDEPATNRGWCLFEGLIAESLQNVSYDASPNTNWKLASFNLDEKYQGRHPNKQMSQYICDLRKKLLGMSSKEILAYFKDNGIECTEEQDLIAVAENLDRFLNTKNSVV